jgi:hypothetical protein
MTSMATPHARTLNEARVYLDLAGCPCRRLARAAGRSFAGRYEAEVLARRPRVVRLTGTCPRCGHPRDAVFELADPPVEPVPPYAFGSGDGPSRLVDAGQWLLASRELAEDARAATGPGDPDAAYDRLCAAASAADEILRFLPPGADAVPDEAFWTGDGLALRAALPDWFERHRLVALRILRWRAVTDFEDTHDIDEPDEVHHAVAS